jgi:hypothetical protein
MGFSAGAVLGLQTSAFVRCEAPFFHEPTVGRSYDLRGCMASSSGTELYRINDDSSKSSPDSGKFHLSVSVGGL